MSSHSSENSAKTPTASTSKVALSTEDAGLMGLPNTTATAPTDEYVEDFIKCVIEEIMSNPVATDRYEIRAEIEKFVSDRVKETITSEDLESDSDLSSGESNLSQRIIYKATTMEEKLNKALVEKIGILLQGIALRKRREVMWLTQTHMERMRKRRKRTTAKDSLGKKREPAKKKTPEDERGSGTKRNANFEAVNKWLESCEHK